MPRSGSTAPKWWLVWLKWINENPLITTVYGGLLVALVSYIRKKAAGSKEEMKQLRGALDVAIRELGNRDQTVVDRLLGTIDRMADSLRPAVRQAVAPIGETASTLTIKDHGSDFRATFDAADKEAILSESLISVGPEATYSVKFTEMDIENGTCKLAIEGAGEERISGRITDPEFLVPNSKYVLAFAAQSGLAVVAKPTIRDGEIERLFISNAA